MRRKIPIILAFILTFMINGVTLGGKLSEPPPKPPEFPKDVTGAYIKGHFTAAYEKANLPQYMHHNVHAVLEWDRSGAKKGMVRGIEKGKETSIDLKKLSKGATPIDTKRLFSETITEPESGNLCKYTAEFLRGTYWDLPNKLHVQKAFGIPEAKCYFKELKIIKKDFCGDLNKQEPDAMIYGEVTILLYIPK